MHPESAKGVYPGSFRTTPANCQSKQFPATALRIVAEAWGMTRDETIALFLECEAKRAGRARRLLPKANPKQGQMTRA